MSGKAKTKIGTRICTEFVNNLKQSDFYKRIFLPRFTQCLEELGDRKITQIVCYGLGSFHNGVSVAPRYQLALLLLMHEITSNSGSKGLSKTIEIYDPKFEERDVAILGSFVEPKFQLIHKDELCARELQVTTLVFMPHLHRHLYHNLVGANWHPESLKRLIVVGNSFREMVDNTILSESRKALHYIKLLVYDFDEIKSRKPSAKESKWPERQSAVVLEDDVDKQRHKALIEVGLPADLVDSEFWLFIFSNQSVHFMNDRWLDEGQNKNKIRNSRLKCWQPAVMFPDD